MTKWKYSQAVCCRIYKQHFFRKKKLLPSGSCGTVGIGGLTLGGGYGFFSRKYGCLPAIALLQLTIERGARFKIRTPVAAAENTGKLFLQQKQTPALP